MQPKLCRICQNPFEPKASNQVICSEDCRKEAARQAVRKWKKAHPEKDKENQRTQYKNRARDAKSKYAYRNTPPPDVIHECINIIMDYNTGEKHRCGKITANNGANRYYCEQCWEKKARGCSVEYPECVYDTESHVADLQGFPGIGKVRKGGPPAR